MTRVGITLPSFRDTAEPAIAAAQAADGAGVDAVFVYDHLFRRTTDGSRRPALEMFALLGAIAVETSRVTLGSLVARATLRPPAMLAHGFDTVARIAGPDRLLAAIGAGDSHSEAENESFGLPFGTMADRVNALRDAVVTTRDHGYPVWVGGDAGAVRALAGFHADGWNFWGAGVARFRAHAADVRALADRTPFTISWGGLVVLAADDDAAEEKARRLGAARHVIVGGPDRVAAALAEYVDAGAEWIIVAPVDSSNPENAALLGDVVAPLLRAR
jgi:alkanesulfonate monooxygenase SsuD/methylene tetrahydromethanopterin reductase-like flavin-dependent oxidoreductase (luciferase family)